MNPPFPVAAAKTAAAGLLAVAGAFGIAACVGTTQTTSLQSPAGQLFCAIQTSGGGTIVAGLVSGASATLGGAAPLVVLATNAGQTAVDQDCAAAAAATGGTAGLPVVPPAVPSAAPLVAIANPASPTVAVAKAS
jgi:hypothetical protein